MSVNVTVVQQDAHWVVIEGSIEGCPQATQRRSITGASLASGTTALADEIATLTTDVQAAFDQWQVVQAALAAMNQS